MKKLMLAAVLVLSVTLAAFAQGHSPKVIALVNKASWCPVCQANGARFKKDIMPMANKNVQIVMNDLSDAKTIAASLPMLKKAGIASFARKNTGTGTLYFIDAKSKKLISEVSLAESDDKIKAVLMSALAKG